jgi:hypothetical protein
VLPVLSLVGLRRVDDCPVRRRDFAEMYPLVGEPLASLLNRELNPVSFRLRFRHPDVTAVQLPEQKVEGAAQVCRPRPL